jgi:hypothetical protein
MPEISPLAKRADSCRQHLTEQQITLDGPGSILRDIQTLIEFIGPHGIRTKSKRGNLPAASLAELNRRLSDPVELHLHRPLLRDYPNLAGLYILLRVLDLARADGLKLWVDAAQLAQWNELNPAERYFALLEAWLLKADGEVLGGPRQRDAYGFAVPLVFLTKELSAHWTTFSDYVHSYCPGVGGELAPWNVQLMMRLGLIEVVPRPLQERSTRCSSRGWLMGKARRTPWGEAVTWALLQFLLVDRDPDDPWFLLRPPEDADFGCFQPAFQPFFPEYQKVFRPPRPEVRPGVYVFKVGFHPRYGPADVWRRLAVPDNTTLYGLVNPILKAFKFWDDDHLHDFRYRDRMGRTHSYGHPYGEEEPFSDEISVGETDLPEKGVIEFTFDYGNTWRFLLRLERIEPPDPKLTAPKVIESAGQPPKQYAGEE